MSAPRHNKATDSVKKPNPKVDTGAEQETAVTDDGTASPSAETLDEAIGQIVDFIPVEKRGDADQILHQAIQRRITRIREELEASSARDIVDIREKLTTGAKEALDNKLKELEKAAGPLNANDMQKLVSQEYLKFNLTLVYLDDTDESEREEVFTIREIPQAAEKQIVAMLTEKIVPLMKKLQGIKFSAGSTTADKLQQAVKAAPEVLDIISEIVAICLNPYGKRKEITADWVQKNVSSARQMCIIEAQFAANRLRDFFYSVSRVSQGM
jgi:hypothetical protein